MNKEKEVINYFISSWETRLEGLLSKERWTPSDEAEICQILENARLLFYLGNDHDDNGDGRKIGNLNSPIYSNKYRDIIIQSLKEKSSSKKLKKLINWKEKENEYWSGPLFFKIREKVDKMRLHLKNTEIQNKRRLKNFLNLGNEIGSLDSFFNRLYKDLPDQERRISFYNIQKSLKENNMSGFLPHLNEILSLRWKKADKLKLSPFKLGLEKSLISGEETSQFLVESVKIVKEIHLELKETIEKALRVNPSRADHNHYATNFLSSEFRAKFFDIEKVLNFLFRISKECFNIEFIPVTLENSNVKKYEVLRNSEKIGNIIIQLWNDLGSVEADKEVLIKDSCDFPTSFVFGRFEEVSKDTKLVGLDEIKGLFHEFGHSIHHLLVNSESTCSFGEHLGLEYLPLEKIQILSYWYELWVYHPEFIHLFCNKQKELDIYKEFTKFALFEFKNNILNRLVQTILDFKLHSSSNNLELEATFQKVCEEFNISPEVEFHSFPLLFINHTMTADPGVDFIFLWTTIKSVELFIPFYKIDFGDISKIKPSELFSPWLNYNEKVSPANSTHFKSLIQIIDGVFPC